MSSVLFLFQSTSFAGLSECLQISAAVAKESKAELQHYQEELDKKSAELKELRFSGKHAVKVGSKVTTGIAASSAVVFAILSGKIMCAAGVGVSGSGIATGFLAMGAGAVAAVAALVAVVAVFI